MMHEHGASADEVNNFPDFLRLFSGEGKVGGAIRSAISIAMSPFQPVPSYVPTIAWSYKQTIFPAASFVYAAQSHGLGTCVMEGFDENRLRNILDIPDRYSIPVVICCGYADETKLLPCKTPRLEPKQVFFDGKFGTTSEDFES